MNTFLYIGLGNVGERFTGTRHNLGIELLRVWVEEKKVQVGCEVTPWKENTDLLGEVSIVSSLSSEALAKEDQLFTVHCFFPTTMMNTSGRAVAAYLKRVSVPIERVVVIHDEVELPLGEVKVTVGGSAKGHNGVRSIQKELGTTEFTRVRLGVGRPPEHETLSDFVLQRFLAAEQPVVEEMLLNGARELTARLSPE